METVKQYTKTLIKKLESFIGAGNIMQANEITANVMVGSMLLMMFGILMFCWILNEFGIFTAEKALMRYCVIVTALIELPILLIGKQNHNEPKWMKYLLMIGVIVMCGNMAAVLTHNVVLVTVIPMVLSIRYYNEKFSAQIAGICVAAFTAATLFSVRYGIWNLNAVTLPSGTVITVENDLRSALISSVDKTTYLKHLLINDFLPRFLAFSVIAIACARIALRGRQLIELQITASEKSSRIETELNLATEIQTSMLPCIFPAFPEYEQLELYAKNIPAKEVGGDFYDYFAIDDDHIALVMADVSGKGVGAALFMTIAKIVLKNQLLAGHDTATAMTNANRQLCENNAAGLFVTTWAAIYEVSTGKLQYTNAGHNPPVLRKKGQLCSYLNDRHGLVLAGFDGIRYRKSEITLTAGDELFLYTDGVTEATDADDKLYGEKRLLDILNEINALPVQEQISEVLADLDRFENGAPQFDDITMMGVRILEKP